MKNQGTEAILIMKTNPSTFNACHFVFNPSDADEKKRFIQNELNNFRSLREPKTKDLYPFSFFLENTDGVLAGIYGQVFLGALQIQDLWVAGPLRRQGIGSSLLQKAEEFGRTHGATFSIVGSFEYYEAQAFYKAQGYFIEHERKGFDEGWSQFLMRKNFE
ncbi:MAG: GNAT family N-acetyltransferase [Caedimonadaceae bacterium]|nr:MAG: GNAT family N-acetyltransferase [Caedimonadaceae bacterium]